MLRDTLPARLREFRKKANLTTADVGKMIGKSDRTVSAWENGRGQPDADMLLRLCSIYGIESLSELVGENMSLPSLSTEELRLLSLFDDLNEEGREKVFSYINDLNLTGIYKKNDPSIVVSKEA